MIFPFSANAKIWQILVKKIFEIFVKSRKGKFRFKPIVSLNADGLSENYLADFCARELLLKIARIILKASQNSDR
jgi:hypothetical protein